MDQPESALEKRNLDYFGIFASGACAVHCVITGVALGSAPLLHFLGSPAVENVLVFLALCFATASIGLSYFRVHRKLAPLAFALVGGVIIVSLRFAPHLERGTESIVSVIGATLLITAHVLNLKLLHRGHAH